MMKKLKLLIILSGFILLMFFNVNLGMNFNSEFSESTFSIEQVSARSGSWGYVSCGGTEPDACLYNGSYTCCKTFGDME